MGQKVNPIGFRISVTKDWDSKWFAKKDIFGKWLYEDINIRKYIKKDFFHISISKIIIHRVIDKLILDIHTARPSLLSSVSRKSEYEVFFEGLSKLFPNYDIVINVCEIKEPEKDAQLVAEAIAKQLQKRMNFRKVVRKSIQLAMNFEDVLGIKIKVSGRLGGAELARSEKYIEGKVSLHTIKANIKYGFYEANTNVGKIGIKVWINNK